MTAPELFDVIELLVGLPENNLQAGAKGAIVEIYSNQHYEIEFTNNEGETLTHLALPATQFVVVWKAVTKTWVPLTDKLQALITQLSEEKRREVLDFALFIHSQKQDGMLEQALVKET